MRSYWAKWRLHLINLWIRARKTLTKILYRQSKKLTKPLKVRMIYECLLALGAIYILIDGNVLLLLSIWQKITVIQACYGRNFHLEPTLYLQSNMLFLFFQGRRSNCKYCFWMGSRGRSDLRGLRMVTPRRGYFRSPMGELRASIRIFSRPRTGPKKAGHALNLWFRWKWAFTF